MAEGDFSSNYQQRGGRSTRWGSRSNRKPDADKRVEPFPLTFCGRSCIQPSAALLLSRLRSRGCRRRPRHRVEEPEWIRFNDDPPNCILLSQRSSCIIPLPLRSDLENWKRRGTRALRRQVHFPRPTTPASMHPPAQALLYSPTSLFTVILSYSYYLLLALNILSSLKRDEVQLVCQSSSIFNSFMRAIFCGMWDFRSGRISIRNSTIIWRNFDSARGSIRKITGSSLLERLVSSVAAPLFLRTLPHSLSISYFQEDTHTLSTCPTTFSPKACNEVATDFKYCN